MENEVTQYLRGKLSEHRDRLINLLRHSSDAEEVEFARSWENTGGGLPSFVHLSVCEKNGEIRLKDSFVFGHALMQFQKANELLDSGEPVSALEKLFSLEKFLVEQEVAKTSAIKLGRRGGKKKHEKLAAEKVILRRYYRENNLIQRTNVEAAEILFKNCEVERSTAKTYAAEFKRLGSATDELIGNLSKILTDPSLYSTEQQPLSPLAEPERAEVDLRLAELKIRILDNGDV